MSVGPRIQPIVRDYSVNESQKSPEPKSKKIICLQALTHLLEEAKRNVENQKAVNDYIATCGHSVFIPISITEKILQQYESEVELLTRTIQKVESSTQN